MSEIRVAVVGFGYWGPKLARNFHEISEASLGIICEQNSERLAHAHKLYPHVVVTRNYSDVLRSDVDAVVVATPVSAHFEVARQALLHGKHILVEKPIAASSEQACSLMELADRHKLILMVGHTFEYNPAVEVLRNIVNSGEIGDVYYVNATRVNLGIFQQDINVLWDLAPHDISILMHILGMAPSSVSARGAAYVRSNIHDVAYISLDFPSGVTAHIHVSWLDPCKIRRITVVGSKKMVVYDDVETLEKIKIYDKGIECPPYTDSFGDFQLSYRYGDIVIPRIPSVEPLKNECVHFLSCIKDGTSAKTDGLSGLKVVRVLEAAQISLTNGGLKQPVAW